MKETLDGLGMTLTVGTFGEGHNWDGWMMFDAVRAEVRALRPAS